MSVNWTIGKNFYQRKITDGLWVVLTRARLIASSERSKLEEEKIIKGRAKDSIKVGHIKLTAQHLSSTMYLLIKIKIDIGSFDVPTIDHSRINHAKLVSDSIERIYKIYKNARIILCTSPEFGLELKDSGAEIIIPNVDKERPMYRVYVQYTDPRKYFIRESCIH